MCTFVQIAIIIDFFDLLTYYTVNLAKSQRFLKFCLFMLTIEVNTFIMNEVAQSRKI